jgi:hypothetical protein
MACQECLERQKCLGLLLYLGLLDQVQLQLQVYQEQSSQVDQLARHPRLGQPVPRATQGELYLLPGQAALQVIQAGSYQASRAALLELRDQVVLQVSLER